MQDERSLVAGDFANGPRVVGSACGDPPQAGDLDDHGIALLCGHVRERGNRGNRDAFQALPSQHSATQYQEASRRKPSPMAQTSAGPEPPTFHNDTPFGLMPKIQA